MKFFNSKTNSNTNFSEGNANGGDDYDSSNLNETNSFGSRRKEFLEDATDYSFDKIDFNEVTEGNVI